MAFGNPTPVTIGSYGLLGGTRWKVSGRLVYGVQEEGETYYWQEYVLVAPDGRYAFLEYEEDDGVEEWRFLEPFTPRDPLTIEEAAGLGVGSMVALGEPGISIVKRDRATLYHREGVIPFEPYRTSDYLDAEKGDVLFVAEWAEGEIEFFRGRLLSRGEVAQALGLQHEFGVARWKKGIPLILAVCAGLGICWWVYEQAKEDQQQGNSVRGASARRSGYWHWGK